MPEHGVYEVPFPGPELSFLTRSRQSTTSPLSKNVFAVGYHSSGYMGGKPRTSMTGVGNIHFSFFGLNRAVGGNLVSSSYRLLLNSRTGPSLPSVYKCTGSKRVN